MSDKKVDKPLINTQEKREKKQLIEIKNLGLSVRTTNCLLSANIFYLSELESKTATELSRLPNMGNKSLIEIETLLTEKDEIIFSRIENTSKEAQSIIRLWNKGASVSEIHFSLGVSRKTISLILASQEVATKEENLKARKAQNFNRNKRNKKILEDWNEKNYTLNDLGQMHSITRERVRQILARAKRLGLHVSSRGEKSKRRKTSQMDLIIEKYKDDFINLYSSKSPLEISKLLGFAQRHASALEELLIKSGEIKRPLSRKLEKINPDIVKRRKMILKYKGENRTIKEIALLTGFSVPTVMNDIFHLKKEGIFVPNSKESGGSLSEEELEFRKGFIEEKIQEGWTKEQIAKGLGLSDGAAVSHFIRKFM